MNRTHLSSQVSVIRGRKRGRDLETEEKKNRLSQIEHLGVMYPRLNVFEVFDTHINT